jgi:hypothetical protein
VMVAEMVVQLVDWTAVAKVAMLAVYLNDP